MNKFIKALIIINGIIIPLFVGFLLIKFFLDNLNQTGYEAESVIVGDELEKAKRDSLALQGISYESPIEIYNSTNMYLPISVMTYEEARQLKKDMLSSGDISMSFYNYFNVLFLDKDYKVIGQLLDKKASISEIFINHGQYDYYEREKPVDKTANNIAYTIGFEDTNKDGKLNSLDDHDLYITDLDRQNFTQVTNQKNVVDFHFINSNTEIFVRYKDRNGVKDEYNPIKFGRYNIADKTFTELKEIEDKLLQIESSLIR